MKYSILLLIGSYLVSIEALTKEEVKQTLKPFAESCTPPPTDKDYDDIITNNPDADMSAMCIKDCIFEKVGLYKDDGIDVELVKQFYGMVYPGKEETAAEMVKVCNEEVKENDRCKKAHAYNMCAIKQMEIRNIPIAKPE